MGFVVVILLAWGAMHAYAWTHVRIHAGLGTRTTSVLGLAMLVLMVAPIAGMMLVRAGRSAIGRPVEVVGMVWAGALFLFLGVALVRDIWNGLFALAGRVHPGARAFRLVGPRVLAVELAAVAALCAYALIEPWRIRTECVRLESPKLTAERPRVRIAVLADVHVGSTVGRRRLARIAERVRRAEPDILLSAGDLVDAEMKDSAELARILADLPAPLGKFAVTGNHEYYAGLGHSVDFTGRAGFALLADACARPVEGLTVAGVNDPTGRRGPFRDGGGRSEQAVLSDAGDGDFVVLLKHRPVVEAGSIDRMDLQVSGHSHRGQIFPFSLLVALYYEHGHGLVEVAPGTHLYTSRGTGTWGPPMRFLSPPEVTVIDLVRAAR